MKLNKNFVQISLTALITSAVFVIPMAFSGTGLFMPEPLPSERVMSWDSATVRQKYYLADRPLRVRYPELDIHGTTDTLEGFTFKAEDLKEILNIDNNNRNKNGQTPDEVYFFLGQEKEQFSDSFLFGLFRKSGHIRLFAVGMKNKTLLNKNTIGGTEISVFDKAEPCPPMCPN